MATLAKNWAIKVVITREDPGDPITFRFEDHGNAAPDRIRFENDDHPGFMVYFKIKDTSKNKTGLRFRPDPDDALRIDQVNGNPPPNLKWPGFIPISVENEGRKLIVYCRNLVRNEEFKFTLRFARPDGTLHKDWDPIGDGLDGPRGTF